MNIDDNDMWKIMKILIGNNNLTKDHINSYNRFIENIYDIIKNTNEIKVYSDIYTNEYNELKKREIIINFADCYFSEPEIFNILSNTKEKVTPNTCRYRNLTYSSTIYVKIIRNVDEIDINTNERNHIFYDTQIIKCGDNCGYKTNDCKCIHFHFYYSHKNIKFSKETS